MRNLVNVVVLFVSMFFLHNCYIVHKLVSGQGYQNGHQDVVLSNKYDRRAVFSALAQILVIAHQSVYWVKQPAHSSSFFG